MRPPYACGLHTLQQRVEELTRFLKVTVGEGHRDLFALTPQGTPGGHNLLGRIGQG